MVIELGQNSILNHYSKKLNMESQAPIEGVYEMPTFSVNEFGWGPSSVPEQFEEFPFAFFSRDDNLGTIGDLSALNSLSKSGKPFLRPF